MCCIGVIEVVSSSDRMNFSFCFHQQLINNAGYFYEPEETLENINFPEQMKQVDICAVGPLRVSAAFVHGNLLKKGSKIIMITSQGGSVSWRFTQNPNGHDYGHHVSYEKPRLGLFVFSSH